MLTAIGHDLRTPITRLKLRAEFMEDDEQRRKMLADLDELEAMVVRDAGLRPRRHERPSRCRRSTWPSCCAPCWTRRATPGRTRRERSGLRGPAASDGPGPAARAEARLRQSRGQRAELWRRRRACGSCRRRAASVDRRGRGRRPGHSAGGDWTACSSRSTASRPAATARPAGSGSACRSRATSCARMAATSRLANRPSGGARGDGDAAGVVRRNPSPRGSPR